MGVWQRLYGRTGQEAEEKGWWKDNTNRTNKETEIASEENKTKLFEKVVLESRSSASEDELESEEGIAQPSLSDFRTTLLQKRGSKDIFTSYVIGSLDRGKISDRHA